MYCFYSVPDNSSSNPPLFPGSDRRFAFNIQPNKVVFPPIPDDDSRNQSFLASANYFEFSENQSSFLKLSPGRTGKQLKTHECSYCGQKFSRNSNLIVHIRRHTGEEPYDCDYCSRRFKSKTHKNWHMRKHHQGELVGDGSGLSNQAPTMVPEIGSGSSNQGPTMVPVTVNSKTVDQNETVRDEKETQESHDQVTWYLYRHGDGSVGSRYNIVNYNTTLHNVTILQSWSYN